MYQIIVKGACQGINGESGIKFQLSSIGGIVGEGDLLQEGDLIEVLWYFRNIGISCNCYERF